MLAKITHVQHVSARKSKIYWTKYCIPCIHLNQNAQNHYLPKKNTYYCTLHTFKPECPKTMFFSQIHNRNINTLYLVYISTGVRTQDFTRIFIINSTRYRKPCIYISSRTPQIIVLPKTIIFFLKRNKNIKHCTLYTFRPACPTQESHWQRTQGSTAQRARSWVVGCPWSIPVLSSACRPWTHGKDLCKKRNNFHINIFLLTILRV